MKEYEDRKAHRSKLLAIWVSLLAIACSLVTSGVVAYRSHARGSDWLSALGLSLDRDFFRVIGDLVIPVLVTGLMLQAARKLARSREKTILIWLGWSLFVFLFVWWSPLHFTLFGP